MMWNEEVEPCPTCPEGWKPLHKQHCNACYEGQIERLKEENQRLHMLIRSGHSATSKDWGPDAELSQPSRLGGFQGA